MVRQRDARRDTRASAIHRAELSGRGIHRLESADTHKAATGREMPKREADTQAYRAKESVAYPDFHIGIVSREGGRARKNEGSVGDGRPRPSARPRPKD